MNVRELIEILGEYDGEMKVLVDGYENGYDELEEVASLEVYRVKRSGDYDGAYRNAIDVEEEDSVDYYRGRVMGEKIKAVLLPRESN